MRAQNRNMIAARVAVSRPRGITLQRHAATFRVAQRGTGSSRRCSLQRVELRREQAAGGFGVRASTAQHRNKINLERALARTEHGA